MVFCALVFFVEISVKKNFNQLLEQIHLKIFLTVLGFINWNYREKNRNYQMKMPKNRFLACFHIMSKKIEKLEFSKKTFKEFLWKTSDNLNLLKTKLHE